MKIYEFGYYFLMIPLPLGDSILEYEAILRLLPIVILRNPIICESGDIKLFNPLFLRKKHQI